MPKKPAKPRTANHFIREWRLHRRMTQEKLGEEIDINSGVYPTEHHAVLAIRFVETQAELDRIRETQNSDTAHQIQVGLNLAECRRLAEQLTHAANLMEKAIRVQPKQ